MPRFRVHYLVAFELNEARAWYAGRSAIVAENFLAQFAAVLARIARDPTAHAPWRAIFRRVRLARFPYLVIFHTNRRWTSVLALVHQRREPGRIFGTLTGRLSAL
jgi:hypothetical protein